MAKLTNVVWGGLCKRMQSIAVSLSGERTQIVEIPRKTGEIGFTARRGAIHLSRDNEIIDPLSESESAAFVMGVFAHELMHRLITNFVEFERTLSNMSYGEAEIFKEIYNVMEDPAIEEQAKYYMGGDLLSCLHYTVMTLYRQSPPLKDAHPMSQVISALIMYGDGGIIKGDFSTDIAKEMFRKILPIVDRTIVETDSKKRVQNAYEVFLLTKPLWEEEAKNADKLRELLKKLQASMAASGKNTSGTCDAAPINPERNEDATDSQNDKKNNRRKITFRKVSKEEMDEFKKNSTSGKDDGVSDIEVLYCDDDTSDDQTEGTETQKPEGGSIASHPNDPRETKSNDGSNDGINEENSSEGSQESDKGVDKESGEKDISSGDTLSGNGDNAQDTTSEPASDNSEETTASTSKNGGGVMTGDTEVDHSKAEVIDEAEYMLPPEEIERIERMVRDIKEEDAANQFERDECYAADLDVPCLKSNYAGATCLNKRIKSTNSVAQVNMYQLILSTFEMEINRLVSQMKRIINNDQGDRIYRSSGKTHIPRVYGSRMTSRLFRRNIEPANKADMCVLFLVDESRSMASQNKSACAMQCVVCLAEAFSRLHIPTKVIGFTADESGYDVVHNHYMHWLNTYEERLNLTSITHRSNNFDGYSIRYATEMLKKRPEEHKLLVILSDGHPAARYYKRNEGIGDTMDAVKCANKKVDVIGVGIGNASEAIWRAMYGSSFIHVANAKDLLANIATEIQKKMKRW